MELDCLSNILLFSSPATVTKILTLSKTTNSLNTTHLWKSLHTQHYELTHSFKDRPRMINHLCEDKEKEAIANKKCFYCVNDNSAKSKILNKEYYELYKSHIIIYCNLSIIPHSSFIICPITGFNRCSVDNYKTPQVCVECVLWNEECEEISNYNGYWRTAYITTGKYLPLSLFYGKQTKDTITVRIAGKIFIMTLEREKADELLYKMSQSFGGIHRNKNHYSPPLSEKAQFKLFIKAHEDLAKSYNLPVQDPFTFDCSDNYRNRSNKYKCNGLILFQGHNGYLCDMNIETNKQVRLSTVIKEFEKRTKFSHVSLQLVSEITSSNKKYYIFDISNFCHSSYYENIAWIDMNKLTSTSKPKINIISTNTSFFSFMASQFYSKSPNTQSVQPSPVSNKDDDLLIQAYREYRKIRFLDFI